MTTRILFLVALFSILGCRSTEPLGPASEAVFDETLLGSWELLESDSRPARSEAPMVIAAFNETEYVVGPLALGDMFLDLEHAARIYLTDVSGYRFLNIQYLYERENFYFARLEFVDEDVVEIYLLKRDLLAENDLSSGDIVPFLAEHAENSAIYERHGVMRYRKISDDLTIKPAPTDKFEADFGILAPHPFAAVKERTTQIPLNHCYSFRFGFAVRPPDGRSYDVYTIHYLPDVPREFGGQLLDRGPPAKLRYDSRVARGLKRVSYGFDEGDPVGPYKMELYINDELHTVIDYSVVELEKPVDCVPEAN